MGITLGDLITILYYIGVIWVIWGYVRMEKKTQTAIVYNSSKPRTLLDYNGPCFNTYTPGN